MESILLFGGLESTVTHLGRSIDELEVDFFELFSGVGNKHGLSEEEESLLGTNSAALEHHVVVSDNTVVREASHGGDVLFGDIDFSGGIVFSSTSFSLSNSIDLLVEFGSMEVTALTSSGNSPGDTGRMPSADTSDFSVTSVGFLLKMADTPSLHDTGEPFSLGDTDDINHFILVEDLVNPDFLFKVLVGEVDLLRDALATVDLDFKDVILLLSVILHQVHLSMGDDSDSCAIFADSVELSPNLLSVLGHFRLIVSEGFPLGVHPVLVESSHSSLVQMLGPDC